MSEHHNPSATHTNIATAIRYAVEDNAPIIVAKGKHELARKLLDIAKAHNITIVQDDNLAERVFQLDIATEIPEELYEVMAQILSTVISIINRNPT